MKHLAPGAFAAALALLLFGCGSSSKTTASGSSTGSSPAYGHTGGTATGTTATPGVGSGVKISAKPNKLGLILAAGSKRMTVYLFEADQGSSSSCSGACAQVWPPVNTSSAPVSGAGATTADISTIVRGDGTRQVTYNGHPLYYYARDGDKGDAYGQGIKSFGASWYVLAPSGSKIDKS